ncbi:MULTISPECIES: hypothetical protein [Acidiplasma]|uniref:CARDB domain-containing protein n=2 Tax=Acidiplasma TaxID=507753 RepID=A0A0Q0RF74_9ARCH|nr:MULTISPECIES: hypothetical protein [Acidiplasma]KPV46312.1 hypothetical protein SE19_06070 [Acidiplasma aeolicum]KQB33737.1 hypothetical protein AOG55_02175 [Acidiplasma cupricumulans]KQB34498.1 hypothetical protein AOG54_04655 [Acidiplasma aeolicum]
MKFKILAIAIVIILIVSGLLVAPYGNNNNQKSQSPSSLSFKNISYPTYVYQSQNFNIYINETSGFTNYSVNAFFGVQNNSDNTVPSDYYKNSSNPDFVIPIVAPNTTENIYVYVEATAFNGNSKESAYTNFSINVSQPVHLNATLTNTASAPAYNITVNFLVNGITVKTSMIGKINAKSNYTASVIVPRAELPPGRDLLTISTNNPNIGVPKGVYFYNGHPPNYDWIYYIAAVTVAFAIFLIVISGRRNTVKVPKWKRAGKKTSKSTKNTK